MWSYCIALQCISWHVMAWLDCCIFIPHDVWCVCCCCCIFYCQYLVMFAIFVFDSYTDAEYQIICVQCPNYISTHKQQQKYTYIVYHLLWRSYSGGELLLPPIRCCVHICLNSTCLCDFSKNLYTFFSTFFSFYFIFTFLSPCIGLVVGRSNVKLSVHSIQNINLFGM